jgi:inhibitor of cysteine peptidase
MFVAGCDGVGNTVFLTDADDGSSTNLPVSARLVVSLPSNPTTGYAWAVTQLDESILENTADQYTPDLVPPGWTGGGGTHVWEFTGRAAGTTTLRLEERQPWEEEEPAASTFEVTVTVTSAE